MDISKPGKTCYTDRNDKIKEADLDRLAEDAYADACRPGNPKDTSVAELKELYRKIM